MPLQTVLIDGITRTKRKEKLSTFWLGDNFEKHILPLVTDGKTSTEVLRQDELQCGTKFSVYKADQSKGERISGVSARKNQKEDSQIIKELNIKTVDANTIAERILQTLKNPWERKQKLISNNNVTIVGYVTLFGGIVYTVVVGFLEGAQFGNRWGIDAHVNIRWVSHLQILSRNKN